MSETLTPCPCGASCRVEVFDSERVKATIYICSANPHFGGKCANTTAYLTPEEWNTRKETQQ